MIKIYEIFNKEFFLNTSSYVRNTRLNLEFNRSDLPVPVDLQINHVL